MSLTPHEIESQELAVQFAHGHTVVMGLGMGWAAANFALQPSVKSVTVVERDPDILRLLTDCGALASLPNSARNKLEFVIADAREWTPPDTSPVDFLFADIWLHLAEPQTLADVRCMHEHVKPGSLYFWGQELALHAACEAGWKGMEESSPAQRIAHAAREVIQLPLLCPESIAYAERIERVIRNRKARGLSTEFSLG